MADEGTIRLRIPCLTPARWDGRYWRRTDARLKNAIEAASHYRRAGSLDFIRDPRSPVFARGFLNPKGRPAGARVKRLPDGRILGKAFSLFAPELTLHDEKTNDHWDVLYRNNGGSYSYVYTREKELLHQRRKYRSVDLFGKKYASLIRNCRRRLYDETDYMALPVYTMLKTLMRIGNEKYYRAHHHKGLTTLKKEDVRISVDVVEFKYVSKDGVPRDIIRKFPGQYILRLQGILRGKKRGDFVFTRPGSKRPLVERDFKEAFKRYCGVEFYPHIIRSHYATLNAKRFLKRKNKPSDAEVRLFLKRLAGKLGHKKYIKKKHVWEDNYRVTVSSYIQPSLARRLTERA
jgi:hypothetical protein